MTMAANAYTLQVGNWNFRITPIRLVLLALTLGFGLLAVYRLIAGLGATTNMNDRWAWAYWLILDYVFIALAGAGYSMALMSHVLHLNDVHRMSRRGMLISLLFYVYALVILGLEIGRWDNWYRPLFYWGYRSPLFEVYIAIMFYFGIQLVEFSEVATEKVFKSANRYVQLLLPTAFVLGAIIPFGHQGALGAIFLAMPHKLHPLWYSSMIPWFYVLTSFYAGLSLLILEMFWSNRLYGSGIDTPALHKLLRIGACLMAAYFVWKLADLYRLNGLGYVFAGGFESIMFLLELGGGVLLPVLIGLSRWGKTTAGLVAFAVLATLGLILNRVNVLYTGFYQTFGPGYTPSLMEWGVSIGLFAAIILAYLFIVENFNIFRTEKAQC